MGCDRVSAMAVAAVGWVLCGPYPAHASPQNRQTKQTQQTNKTPHTHLGEERLELFDLVGALPGGLQVGLGLLGGRGAGGAGLGAAGLAGARLACWGRERSQMMAPETGQSARDGVPPRSKHPLKTQRVRLDQRVWSLHRRPKPFGQSYSLPKKRPCAFKQPPNRPKTEQTPPSPPFSPLPRRPAKTRKQPPSLAPNNPTPPPLPSRTPSPGRAPPGSCPA